MGRASRRMRVLIFLTLVAFCFAASQEERDGKVFSLFSVVQFKNLPCTSTDKISSASTQNRNGTCVTTSECIDRGGAAKGNCAAGFGVCCVQIIDEDSNTDVNYNDTYLQNPDYPSSYGDEGSITYKVNKLNNDICFLRLDFEQFDVIGLTLPATTCDSVDHIEITGTGSGLDFPAICGNLAGQHMYVSMGNDEGDNADIKVVVNGDAAGNTRKWEIKVAQLPCHSDYSPPEGCTQWFTEPSGTISDWGGADNILQDNLNYNVCVRQNYGYCCVEYQACGGTGDFAVRTQAAAAGPPAKAGSGTNCQTDWISIDGAGASCGPVLGTNKFCNDLLHFVNDAADDVYTDIPICDCTPPFQIGVHTDADIKAAVVAPTGFCLNYRQLKC